MMEERRAMRYGAGMNAQRKSGRNVGRSRPSLTRVRLEHHQSAPKLNPEEQQITHEYKREGE